MTEEQGNVLDKIKFFKGSEEFLSDFLEAVVDVYQGDLTDTLGEATGLIDHMNGADNIETELLQKLSRYTCHDFETFTKRWKTKSVLSELKAQKYYDEITDLFMRYNILNDTGGGTPAVIYLCMKVAYGRGNESTDGLLDTGFGIQEVLLSQIIEIDKRVHNSVQQHLGEKAFKQYNRIIQEVQVRYGKQYNQAVRSQMESRKYIQSLNTLRNQIQKDEEVQKKHSEHPFESFKVIEDAMHQGLVSKEELLDLYQDRVHYLIEMQGETRENEEELNDVVGGHHTIDKQLMYTVTDQLMEYLQGDGHAILTHHQFKKDTFFGGGRFEPWMYFASIPGQGSITVADANTKIPIDDDLTLLKKYIAEKHADVLECTGGKLFVVLDSAHNGFLSVGNVGVYAGLFKDTGQALKEKSVDHEFDHVKQENTRFTTLPSQVIDSRVVHEAGSVGKDAVQRLIQHFAAIPDEIEEKKQWFDQTMADYNFIIQVLGVYGGYHTFELGMNKKIANGEVDPDDSETLQTIINQTYADGVSQCYAGPDIDREYFGKWTGFAPNHTFRGMRAPFYLVGLLSCLVVELQKSKNGGGDDAQAYSLEEFLKQGGIKDPSKPEVRKKVFEKLEEWGVTLREMYAEIQEHKKEEEDEASS